MKVWPPTVAGAQAAEAGADKDGFVPMFEGKTCRAGRPPATGSWRRAAWWPCIRGQGRRAGSGTTPT